MACIQRLEVAKNAILSDFFQQKIWKCVKSL